jgi:hypothetical protein
MEVNNIETIVKVKPYMLTKIVMSAHSSFIFLNASSHTSANPG